MRGGCACVALEQIYTTIESLTADGRDQSLDYKISGFLVPRGSDDARVVAAIAPRGDEIVLAKSSASVFNSTSLEYVLRNIGIEQLAVCGIVSNQCIESTIRDAADRGFLCSMVTDATAAHCERDQLSAEHNLAGFARLDTTDNVLHALRARPR
uniref:Isochorismatase-like domain-containing protein n=1 Tax=Erythrolobus australicus TaxID=1077150 RepID=A0A6T5WN92_9RHOD|mmetsp:Transcript_3514/g.9665  ORF Transcript_3514/g.9665 Transcript_3514/m.9665 type:complete len:154 (+) Transcript_3514:501-962(+)